MSNAIWNTFREVSIWVGGHERNRTFFVCNFETTLLRPLIRNLTQYVRVYLRNGCQWVSGHYWKRVFTERRKRVFIFKMDVKWHTAMTKALGFHADKRPLCSSNQTPQRCIFQNVATSSQMAFFFFLRQIHEVARAESFGLQFTKFPARYQCTRSFWACMGLCMAIENCLVILTPIHAALKLWCFFF